MSNEIVNSHIQMPKCALKQFELANKLAYFSVNGGFIGTNGHAKTIYTELGYYSAEIEERLNDEVETPFSEMLQQVKKIDFDVPVFSKPAGFDGVIRRYMDALLIRSPIMQEKIGQNSVFYDGFPDQMKHDIAVVYGLNLTKDNSLLRNFIPTFAYNKTNIQFVLPVCGMYECRIYNYIALMLPITPLIAVVFLEAKAQEQFTSRDTVAKFCIEEEDALRWFNSRAIKKQTQYNCGFVVATDRLYLDYALSDIEKNNTQI